MDCCGHENRNGQANAPMERPARRRDNMGYQHRYVVTVDVAAAPSVLFEHLDDHERLAAHMIQSSAMMAGSAMNFSFDQKRGRRRGSRIAMQGTVFGIALDMSEVVTEYDPPHRKVWQTEGKPQLLVIGDYSMGFEVAPGSFGSRLSVFIEYNLPAWPWRLLGLLAAHLYARWCVRSMANDAARRFAA